ncbi:glutamate receptor ionotropic, delta-2-like isoform X2 [Haemaphysalis longicornis]
MPYSNVSVHDGSVIIGGTMGNVLDSLQQCLNFSYTASIPEDRQWGRIFPDGTATGMIGMLVRNEADWAVNPFAQTHERFLATRFTAEMLCADFAILAGSPRDDGMGGASLFGYIFAFDWQVWAMLVLFLQLLPLLLAIGDHLLLGVAMSASYIGHWYHLVKICCLEASNESHRRRDVRSRLVVGVWWLANLILLTALTGNMKAGLTVRTAGERVDSIADVARRKDLTPILWKGTAYESVVKNTPLDVYQSVYRRVIERNGTRTGSELYTPETFRLVLSGRAVVLNEQPSMLYNVARACTSMPQGQFYFAREPVFNQGISMTLRRGLDLATHNRISRKCSRWRCGTCGPPCCCWPSSFRCRWQPSVSSWSPAVPARDAQLPLAEPDEGRGTPVFLASRRPIKR